MNQRISFLNKSIETTILTSNMFRELLCMQVRFSQRILLLKWKHLLLPYSLQSKSHYGAFVSTERIPFYPLQGFYILRQCAMQSRSSFHAQRFLSSQLNLAKKIKLVKALSFFIHHSSLIFIIPHSSFLIIPRKYIQTNTMYA